MATTCPKCGASLLAGASYCQACGQPTAGAPARPVGPAAAGPAAAGPKKMPVAALVVLIGGFVVLLAAGLMHSSGMLFGRGVSTAAPETTAATPADTGAQGAAAPPPVGTLDAQAGGATTPGAVPASATSAPAAADVVPAAPPDTRPSPGAAAAAATPARPSPPPPPPFRKTYECREYATFKIDPDTTIVTVDGEVIGIADQWADTPRTKKYKFESKGVHYVKLSHRGYETLWLRFIVSDDALDKTAIVKLDMKKADDDKDDKKKDDEKKDDKKKDDKKKDDKK